MSPSPTRNHQEILGEIFLAISNIQPKGKVFLAPFDVFLDEESNAVQPDIIFVAKEKMDIVKSDAVHGVPTLLIEILLPGNTAYDTVRKKALYEKFGIQEYWIVNPDTKETIGYLLKDNIYIECGRFNAKLHSMLLGAEIQF
jgi:Uma2 family endonuclease